MSSDGGTNRNGSAAAVFGACPVPRADADHILLGHGSGGRLTADLSGRVFVPAFGNDVLAALEDQATLPFPPAPPAGEGARRISRFFRASE